MARPWRIPALVALACAAWASAGADPVADEAAIRQRLAAWADAFNNRDAAAACDLFAPDLAYTVPGVLEGTRETMCANLARMLGRSDIALAYAPPAIHEIVVAGDVAVVRLDWTLTSRVGGEAETSSEAGIDIFRRQPDGRWSIARFIAFDTALE